jgi:NADPH-dependent glutamate synthase beta subunit-like oxidoreductase
VPVQSGKQKMTDHPPAKSAPPLFLPHSSASTELNKTGSWRYVRPVYDEKTSPCSAACPLGEDIASIAHLVSRNLIAEARQTLLIENPFPAVCGRVCFHNCESACNRAQLDEPIAIHHLERFVGDTLISGEQTAPLKARPANGKKVAIAGAGPAGLAAAYFLSLLGYRCEVYEAAAAAGGVLRWGIPAYRLPLEVVEKEISRIEELGVIIHYRTPVTGEVLKTFKTRYDAAFIGCGHGQAIDLKIDGAQKAIDGLQLLYRIRAGQALSLAGNAAIIGGGNTAVDVARSLLRLGVDAIIVYRRRRQDMPAFDPEIQMALNEGVKLMALLSPIRIEAAESHSTNRRPLFSLTLQKMKVSDTEIRGRCRVVPDGDRIRTLRVNHVISAIGAEPQALWQRIPTPGSPLLNLSHCKLIHDDMPIAYGGDLTNRVKSVSDAIASGKQAAIALDTYFKSGWDAVRGALDYCQVGTGPAVSLAMHLGETRKNRNPHIVSCSEMNIDHFKSAPRAIAPVQSVADRIRSFLPFESALSAEAALAESRRCFSCGFCNECDICRLYCPEMSVRVNGQQRDINLDYCKGCGLCVIECPRNAMALKEETT